MEVRHASLPVTVRRLVACLLVIATICSLCTTSSSIARSERKVLRMDGDLIIGALFSVHAIPPTEEEATARRCGKVREQYGIQRVEVMLQTLEKINNDSSILPNVKLGCEIRDSCWYSSVALEQSLQFVSDTLDRSATSSAASNIPPECSVSDPAAVAASADDSGSPAVVSATPSKQIAAVIGPGSSEVAIQVQNLLQLFNIPQVAYSATSLDLSDKTLCEYFLRVCPSDTLQAQAMVDIVLRYNWTYVSVVHTIGNYGESGMQAFRSLAEARGICIAAEASIYSTSKESDFDKIIDALEGTPTAHVVVCFCEGVTVSKLLKATRRKGKIGKYLLIGSDGWANRKEVIKGVEEEAVGAISIKPHTEHYQDFDSYYLNLRPENNSRNPWFTEFWQERFNCLLPPTDAEPTGPPATDYYLDSPTNCTGEESLEDGYNQDTKMSFVVNAIYTVAYGLHNLQQQLCGAGTVGLCPRMHPIDGRELLDALLNVSFIGVSRDHIKFDRNGDPPGRYDIYNFQRSSDGTSYGYVTVGDWADGVLTMNDTTMMWNNGSGDVTRSFCSNPCPPHHAKNIRDNVECCWACVPCKENEFMLNEYTCKSCKQGWWPNEQLDGCNEIEAEYMKWNEVQAILAMCFSCVGILMTVFVTVTFIRHNDTALVKASSRENSYILLAGIYLCFLVSFPYIAKPSTLVCYFRRIGLGLSFCICYAGLVVRTNRMARILAGSKKKILTRKPRFLGSTAQVVMTCGVISVEIAIIATTLVLERPTAVQDYPDLRRVRLVCNTTILSFAAPLGYDAFLISLCTLYAFKTRNLPENFNEAKYIAFTMYTTCIIWLAFIPLYFGSQFKEIVVCFAVSLSATVTLGCLFFPKTYIILLKPERNRRSSMTTSNLVRMHVGSFSELAPCRSNSSSNGTMDGCNEKLLGSDRNAVGMRSNRKKQSPNPSSLREKARDKNRDKSPGFFFSALRRRKRPRDTKHMKAVQRDRLLSKRKQPVYRYGNSTHVGGTAVAAAHLQEQPSPVEEGDSSIEKELEERLTRSEDGTRGRGCLRPSLTKQRSVERTPRGGDLKTRPSFNVEMEVDEMGRGGAALKTQKSIMKHPQGNIEQLQQSEQQADPREATARTGVPQIAEVIAGPTNPTSQAQVLPLRVRRSFSDETINKKASSSAPAPMSTNNRSDSRFLGVDRQQHPRSAGGSFNQIYPDLLQVLPAADVDPASGDPLRGHGSAFGAVLAPDNRANTNSPMQALTRDGGKRSVRFDERTLSAGDIPSEPRSANRNTRWSDGDHVVTIPNEVLGALTSIKSSDV